MDKIAIFIENINYRPEYLIFLLFAASLIVILFFAARLLKYYLPHFSYGLLITVLWSLLINIAFLLDFLRVSPVVYYLLLTHSIISFTIYTIFKKKVKISEIIKDGDTKYLLKLFVAWAAGIFIILIPLFFLLPKGTIIPAAGISTDSLVHSLLANGSEFTQEIGLNTYWDQEYPRGFHAFIYYSNEVLNIDVRVILMPMVALGYSFIIFFVEDLINKKRYVKGINKFLLLLVPFVSFLILTTSYALFLAQIAVIPLLLICLNFILKKNIQPDLKNLIIFTIIFTAISNIYGVYAVNVIFIGLAIKIAYELWQFYQNREKIQLLRLGKSLMTFFRKNILILAFLLITAIPSAILLYRNTISAFVNSTITFQGEGNLRSGFLSPFHITGLWQPGLEYRDELNTFFIYLLLGVLLFQLFFIFKTQLSKNIYRINSVLMLLIVISLIIFRNVYIHFKYLTYFVPFFLILFGLSVVKFFNHKYTKFSYLATLILAAFTLGSIISSSVSLRKLPAATEQYFSPIEEIKEKYLDKNTALIISGDAWSQYYIKDGDDYIGFADYAFPEKRFNNQDIDILIIDTYFDIEKEVEKLLNKYPEILIRKQNTPSECINQNERFFIYNLKCSE